MKRRCLHSWDVPTEEAEATQLRLAALAREDSGRLDVAHVKLVAGAALSPRAAAVVVLEDKTWTVVEAQRIELPAADASAGRYHRGLMGFAFGPPLLAAFEKVESKVDVVMFLGHGLAHPRRCGMATHVGLLLETPSLGCAERLLCGESIPPGPERGDWTPVTDQGEVIGACVRTRAGAKPLYVSPGYRMNIEGAVELALRASERHRWPEPLTQARVGARGA